MLSFGTGDSRINVVSVRCSVGEKVTSVRGARTSVDMVVMCA